MKLQVGEKLPLKERLQKKMLRYLRKYRKMKVFIMLHQMSREICCTRAFNINTTYKNWR